jgi:hypothetical protein
MIKISTKLIEPKADAGAFAAQAKTCWRAGTRYARFAEAADSANRIQSLVIINEPNIWVINLYNKTGRHIVDPGPSLNVHAPIFPSSGGTKTKLNELEFGQELEFFVKNGAKQSIGGIVKAKTTERYDLTVDGDQLVLWTDARSKIPVRVSLIAGYQTRTIEYVTYDGDLPFDDSLFKPPPGIVFDRVQ